MRLPINSPVSTDSARVPLIGNADRRKRTAEIGHPETKYPLDHSVNAVDPHENAEAYRQAIRDLVAGMAARGSFDQDNLEALNNTIDSWLQTWVGLALTTATRRREVAEQLLAQTLHYQREVILELDGLHAERIEITAARDELLRQLGFSGGMLQTERPAPSERMPPASRIRVLRATAADAEPREEEGL